MKNIMRRTVALMLMACLLLSVMAPITFAADGDTLTYVLASGDGKVYQDNKTSDDDVYNDDGSIKTDYEPLDYTKVYGSGDSTWQLVKKNSASGFVVNTSYINGNIGGQTGRYMALKLNNITEAGTYTMTVTLGRSQSSAVVDVHVLPGATSADEITTASMTEANKMGQINSYSSGGASQTVYLKVSEAVLGTSNSCIVVFRGTGTGTNFSPEQIDLTKSADAPPTVTMSQGVYTYGAAYSGVKSASNGYLTTMGVTVGSFVLYAQSGTMIKGTVDAGSSYTATSGSIQANNNSYYKTGKWFALEFNVNQTGTYDVKIESSYHKDSNIYLLPATTALIPASGDTANQEYIDSKEPTGKLTGTAGKASEISFVGQELTAGNYYLIFESQSDGTGMFRFSGMTLTPYHVQSADDATKTYSSVENAISDGGETNLTLIGDITENVAVEEGVTLNLGGCTINGTVTTTGTGKIEGEGYVTGTLAVASDHQMPLADENGKYKFYAPTDVTPAYQKNATTDCDEYWFDVLLDNDAYTRIATGKSGMKVNVDITWKPADWAEGDDLKSLEFAYAGDAVKAWADGEIGGNNYGLCVQFTNIPENVSDVTVKVTYEANGAAVEYESTVAANG